MRVLPVELFVRTAKDWNVSIGVSMASANTRKKNDRHQNVVEWDANLLATFYRNPVHKTRLHPTSSHACRVGEARTGASCTGRMSCIQTFFAWKGRVLDQLKTDI